MTAITERLAAHAAGLDAAALPAPVRQRAAEMLLDLWGIMARAQLDADTTACFRATLADLGLDAGSASVVAEEAGFSPYGAALFNGALAHSLDFDDTHAAGSIHPGATVIPAALAAAEIAGADGRTLIAAIVAGYDVVCRLSVALGPSRHYARGFHPTATCGAFGAAAAAGRALGLSPERMAAAFGLAASRAAGSLQFLENGAWNKRWQVGAAAADGLSVALAARNGFHAAAAPLEGRFGFFKGYTDGAEPDEAVADLGSRFSIMETAVKPYPACRYTHAALDGILALRAEHGIAAGDVEAIEIGLPQTGVELTGVPADAKRRPRSVVDGQFSMPFVASMGLLADGLAWDDYARYLGKPEVDALCDRVTVAADPRAEAFYPRQMSATVAIITAAGRVETVVEVPSGEPERFPDAEAQRRKFTGLTEPLLGAAGAAALADALLAVETLAGVDRLFALSVPAAADGAQRMAAAGGAGA